ncbi:MAG: hypothetical protein LBG44_09760 [Gemmatimonadota bacterium]|jgi:hypothetical protein|nr:hypothetical protein [Gemmatimonadota bacterium]
MAFFSVIFFGLVFVGAPIARAIATRIGGRPHSDAETAGELTRLRDEVSQLSGQLARLEEEHSFMVKLLEANGSRRSLTGDRES